MSKLKTIYLVGFMGSGKSTIGAYVQKNHAVSFMDTDTYVTKTERKEIPAIFAEEGEAAFRRYETEALVSLTDIDVIATGGGIVEKEVNRSYMKEHGIVVYLQAPFHEIMNRLQHDASRPLWNQEIAEREKLFNRRHEMYQSVADVVIETESKTIEEISATILALMNQE